MAQQKYIYDNYVVLSTLSCQDFPHPGACGYGGNIQYHKALMAGSQGMLGITDRWVEWEEIWMGMNSWDGGRINTENCHQEEPFRR